jgi:hypothetical protein
MNLTSCLAVVAAMGSTLSASDTGAQGTLVESHKTRPPADPNQKICEDLTMVGSRLTTKRICATRAEWAAKKQQDKDEVDRIQRNLCVPTKSDTCDPGS